MKYTMAITITAASFLALASFSGNPGQGKGGGSAKQVQQTDQAQDSAHHADMHQERKQMKDRTLHEYTHTLGDGDIYGSELMSAAERERFRKQLQSQTSETAREQFQLQHEKSMQERARQQGRDLVPPGQGPVYGGELMTVQERNTYREQLRKIVSDEERARFEVRHREKMNERARALQLDIEEAE